MMEMELDGRLLRAFVTVSETGNVTHAASRLGRTQPALSMQLRRLEDEMGAQLLKRSPRGVVLTEAGEILLSYARKTLALAEDVRHQIAKRQLVGRMRLGVLEDLALTRLPTIVMDFRHRHPSVEIELTSASSLDLADALEMGRCDIVMADTACFRSPPSERISRKLVYCGARPIDLDLSTEISLVVFEGSCSWQDQMLKKLTEDRVAWRVACRVTTFASFLMAVRAEMGIAPVLPESVPHDCEGHESIEGMPAPPVAEFGIYIAESAVDLATKLAKSIKDSFDQ